VFDRPNRGSHPGSVTDSGLLDAGLLHELFERQADVRPQAPAVLFGGGRITYRELEERANRLARLLRSRGIGRGDCVGMLLPRSPQVYVTLLGILKTGAAYVPLDPEYPAERIRFILADCRARALVTVTGARTPDPRALPNQEIADEASPLVSSLEDGADSGAAGFSGIVIDLDHADLAGFSSDRLGREETGTTPEDLCYVIYTSGTTGRPKGVEIEHRSVYHLVRAEGEIFRVQPADRVYQGFSIAFDASVEEVWLAFCAGATLVAGSAEMVRAGNGLSRLLMEAGVTVLSCVPTLLSMMEDDVPSVRLLILGGEVCPPDLIRRWWQPGRRLVNTYGPTEATIIATYGDCHPDRPVTIGRPLPNYDLWILDESLRPVPEGAAGELCLGGIGLARGYMGQPDLTQEKFIFFAPQDSGKPQRLYRTGDVARRTAEGEIEFLGRIDAQVKIRGFRVELSGIEAVLMECPGVKAAAVAFREDVPGLQRLVAYAVPRGTVPLNEKELRRRLGSRLPTYMVPAQVESLAELPMLPSGKVDRSRLPKPRCRPVAATREIVPPATPVQKQIAAVWADLVEAPVSTQDDFFLDLGGHSLLAARMVSELRKTAPLERISMADVYRFPTVASLAARFEQTGDGRRQKAAPSPSPCTDHGSNPKDTRSPLPAPKPASPASDPRHGGGHRLVPFWRHFWCGAAQAVSLVFVLTFFAMQWLTPYLIYTILIEEEYGFARAIVGAFASLILFYPIMLVVPIVAKWLLIGRYKPGTYPLWGLFYFRWWLATTIETAVPVSYLTGTPLLNIYLRLMGAKVGRNARLHSNNCVVYDLLAIGEDSSINADSNLLGYRVEEGLLKIGHISIGKRCFVGARATLREDTAIEDDGALEDLSLLPRGATIPRGETWVGSPAQWSADASSAYSAGSETRGPGVQAAAHGATPPLLLCVLHALGLLTFPVLVVGALFPGIVVMNKLNYIDPYYWYLLLAPMVGMSFVVLLCLEIAAVKWLLLGRVQPGRHSLNGFYYLRKWFVDQTMDLSLDVLGPLYASVYLAPWYRLLGARLGRGAELSTASFISPDLLSIGEESFIADSVSLGAPRVRDGYVTIGPNRIGRRSFIGNSAMLPPGTVIGDGVLIGCLSTPPRNPADALRRDTAWLGSPALFLPRRQASAGFSEETTFNPPVRLRILRALIELVRVITPSTCFIVLLSLLFSALLLLRDHFSLVQTLLFCPPLYIGCGFAAAGIAIAAKWVLVGRYRPREKPLWSTFVWRNELLNALHEHLAEPFLVGPLTGTPFICWYFRLLGARIGRRVYMETTDLSEFDLAEIGDEAMLNADCTIQTHLFEDRVMKMSTVRIGPRCTVGAGSLVLYDTRMEADASLGDLSLLMKGEVLPAGTAWEGVPARCGR